MELLSWVHSPTVREALSKWRQKHFRLFWRVVFTLIELVTALGFVGYMEEFRNHLQQLFCQKGLANKCPSAIEYPGYSVANLTASLPPPA